MRPSVRMGRQNTLLQVVLDACVCGPIRLPDTVPTLRLRDTILDATLGERFIAPPPDGDAPAWTPDSVLYAPGSRVTIETCTLFGEASVYHMEARDTLFTRRLVVERRQSGCIRYSYLAPESLTPRRYRCQPESEASDRVEQAEKQARAAGLVLSETEADAIRSRTAVEIVPRFTTRRFGAPAYAQLRHDTPAAIRAGSSRGGEMGAFAALALTQREANLLTTLDEYLRLGIEAGILYAT